MAVVAEAKSVAIHVYEKAGGGGAYKRIATFGDDETAQAEAHVLYGGRIHYDALQLVA